MARLKPINHMALFLLPHPGATMHNSLGHGVFDQFNNNRTLFIRRNPGEVMDVPCRHDHCKYRIKVNFVTNGRFYVDGKLKCHTTKFILVRAIYYNVKIWTRLSI